MANNLCHYLISNNILGRSEFNLPVIVCKPHFSIVYVDKALDKYPFD